jgi:hypothetical protein
MRKLVPSILATATFLTMTACSPQTSGTAESVEGKDPRLTGDAFLTVRGLPEGTKVVTMTWFEGRDDDHFQGEIIEYTDGMTIPAGKLMFLIEGKGYEPLFARRIPVYGDTVLEAKMCKIDERCYGTLTRVDQ